MSGFGCFILATGIFRGQHTWKNYRELQAKKVELVAIVEKIKASNLVVKNELDLIKNQKTYARKVLKDRYHKVNDDEEIIFFDDENSQ
jgi:cell division protein FtsB